MANEDIGIDVFVPHSKGHRALRLIAEAVCDKHWPEAIYEDGETNQVFLQIEQVPFEYTDEVFVYRDAPSMEAWNEYGLLADLKNHFLHLLHEPGGTVVVFDQYDSEMRRLLITIVNALE